LPARCFGSRIRKPFFRILLPPPASTIQGPLRFLRVFHGPFLLSMILYPIIGETMALRNQANVNPIIWPAFIIQTIVIAGIAVWIRETRVRSAVETLRLKPDDGASFQRWRSGRSSASCCSNP
jgi:hypothetical protein